EKIGFCCGAYDLLHPGHMKHLEQAKKICDVLIVAVTCDKYVKERKGNGRPIYNEKQRVFNVSGLKSVDYA
ncbi:adenylyltransferase/cytidyltransferase family protein, partial [Faecalibacillus intestinalis]|uniref:adenylyltransferase/cytidyltransferase family protein n=1 Tax=Faecalibacillus intestinalis TaxID=1982626 RepID=UPI001EDFBB7C